MKHSIVTITIISCISGQLWSQYGRQRPGNAEKPGKIYSEPSSDQKNLSQYDNLNINNQDTNDSSTNQNKQPYQQQSGSYIKSDSFNSENTYSKSQSGNSDNSQYNDFDNNKQGNNDQSDNYSYPSSQRQRGGYPKNNRYNPGNLGEFTDIYSKLSNDRSGPSQYGEKGPGNKDTDGIYNGDYSYPWKVQPGNYPMAPQIGKYPKNNRQIPGNSGSPESIYSKSSSDANSPIQYQQHSSNSDNNINYNIYRQVSSQQQQGNYPNNKYNPGNSGNPASIYSKSPADNNGPRLNYKDQSSYSQTLSQQPSDNYPNDNNYSQEDNKLNQDDYINPYSPSLDTQRGKYPNSLSDHDEHDGNHDHNYSSNELYADSYDSYNYGPNSYGHNTNPQQVKFSDNYANEYNFRYRPDQPNPTIKLSDDYTNNNNDRHRGGKFGSTNQFGENYDNQSDYSNAQSKQPDPFDNSNNGDYTNKNIYPNLPPSSGQFNPQRVSFTNDYANENNYRYGPGGRTRGSVRDVGGNSNIQYSNSDPQYSPIGNIKGYKDQLGSNANDSSNNNNPENPQSQQLPSNNPDQNQQSPANNSNYGKNIINDFINHPTVSRIGKLFGVGGFLSALEQH